MPIHIAPQRDPRSIITPDAFEVAPALLGLPLASPGRRLAALLVDLAVIGMITLLTKSFALVLGLVAAALFIREGFMRTPVRGSAFGRAMRLSVGCLGTWIGIITIVAGLAVAGKLGSDRSDDDEPPERSESPEVPEAPLSGVAGLMTLVEGVGDARRIERAATREEALAAAGDSTLVREVADSAQADSMGTPFVDALVADSLRKLQAHVASLTASTEAQQRDLLRLREELRQEQEGGALLATLRGFLDELGFGFGWASLYLTVMLSWWKGQTIGKRLLKIRVLRLDGEAITWWTAFERAGGYAAGLATGLLGFAQVYWDSNRQAIHDRIVGTVVVVDGAEKVIDWEKTL